MHMEISENGCLTIVLTEQDLQQYGLRFEDLDYTKPATRAVIQSLLATARREMGFDSSGSLLIEALPTDDGCILLITPTGPHRKIRMKRAAGPYIYNISDEEALFQLASAWQRAFASSQKDNQLSFSSSLYEFNGEYRLIIYGLPLEGTALLQECGRLVGEGDAVAAFTAEHGKALAIGDALPRLCAAVQAAE